ncbi:MAG TPA: hypothetical protein VGD00_11895 [Solirubrobacteraceae bacterium]|jgi:hypothetical protein
MTEIAISLRASSRWLGASVRRRQLANLATGGRVPELRISDRCFGRLAPKDEMVARGLALRPAAPAAVNLAER